MKWITKYTYIDLNTGEQTETTQIVEEEKNKQIIIIKTIKKTKYVNYSTRLTEITKLYRRAKYKQPTIFTIN